MIENDATPTLGAALREAREQHGLDRQQLARLLGVATSAVTRWERDTFKPSPEKLIDLARQLEIPSSYLFELAGVPLPDERASLPAMLRAEYDLPAEAIAEIQANIERVAQKYRSGS